MYFKKFYDKFRLDKSILKNVGFNPYYKEVSRVVDDKLLIDHNTIIDFATNNYLGIINEPAIINAMHNALDVYGASLCATPIAGGFSDLYKSVTNKLCRFIGIESGLLYPSCYQGNIGLLSLVAKKEDEIIIDQYSHSSLIEGARAVGCKIRPYLHNNMNSLEKNLKNSKPESQKIVVTESVFSTEGSIAPLGDIVELCKKYDAMPVVDDSHGIGVIGEHGHGILEHQGISDYDGIYTASLGKAIANLGGIVGGKKSLVEYMKYYSTHLVYSTSIPPHILAGINATIDLIEEKFSVINEQILQNKKVLSDALVSNGFKLANSQTPIISVKVGESEDALRLAKLFFENNMLTTPFIYPSVPKGEAVIRIIAGANLSSKSLQDAITGIEKAGKAFFNR